MIARSPAPPPEVGRGRALAEVACVGLVLVASWPLLAGRCHTGGDVVPFALPHLDALQRELAAGRLRTWDPALFCGYYAHGAGQAGSLYPVNLALLALLPLLAAYKASVLLHQWLLVRGLLGLVVELGGTRRAGVLAGGALLLSGSVATHVGHHNVVVALGWTPVVLWLAARTARRPGALAPLLLAAACGASLLQGHPQWVAYQGLAALVLAPCVAAPGRARAACALVAAALAGAALLAAGLLLPMFGYQEVFPRPHVGGSLEFLAGGGARLADVPTWLVAGTQADAERVLLPGAVVVALAAARLLAGGLDGPARAALALVAIGVFLAPGASNPVYPLLVHVPPFSLFREPARVLVLAELGLVLLAAGGLDLLRRGAAPRLAVPLAAAGLPALALAAGATRGPAASCVLALVGLASVVALAAAGRTAAGEPRPRRTLRRGLAAGALAAALLELAPAYHATVPTAPDAELTTPPPLAALVAAAPNRRVLDLAGHAGREPLVAARRLRRNGPTRFGVEYLSGFESAVPPVQELLVAELQRAGPGALVDLAAALSVGWLVVDAPLAHPALRLAGRDAGALLYEHRGARPPCYLETSAGLQPARLTAVTPTDLRVTVELGGPATLVVAYAWFPWWTATVDGREVDLALERERLFARVPLAPGPHEVRLAFEDPYLDLGLRVSLGAWAAWALAVAAVVRRGARLG